MLEKTEIEKGLAQFTGTQHYYEHWTGMLKWTDGIEWLAEVAECHWLLDVIAINQDLLKSQDDRMKDMQFWKFRVNPDRSATLVCIPDSDEPPTFEDGLHFTDFPLEEIDIWVQRGVALLPGEY